MAGSPDVETLGITTFEQIFWLKVGVYNSQVAIYPGDLICQPHKKLFVEVGDQVFQYPEAELIELIKVERCAFRLKNFPLCNLLVFYEVLLFFCLLDNIR